MEWIINHTDKLTVEAKKITIDFLNQLPEGHSLCHGDMNPNNILLSEQGPVVIDWMSATLGNPAGDVARIIIVLKYSALPSDLPFLLRIIAKMLLSSFCALYIKRYIKITGINRDEIKQWEMPIAAGSLFDNAPLEETKRLLKFIHKELNLDSASL